MKGEPTVAELAVTVVDSHQGRGLGGLLLAMLSRSAAQNGIETFLGYVPVGKHADRAYRPALGRAGQLG